MILYHGTNIDFSEISLEKCLPYKDFGKGFYLTDIEEQAERMAVRRSFCTEKSLTLIKRV